MTATPAELKYTESHEWIKDNGDGTLTLGITEHAQSALGDIVFVELPEVGDDVDARAELAVVESVKAASDIYAPVSGEVVAVNEDVVDAPETVNEDCYGAGWMVKLKPSDASSLSTLLSAEAYQAHLDSED